MKQAQGRSGGKRGRRGRRLTAILLALALAGAGLGLAPQLGGGPAVAAGTNPSGLPIPRFVSLRSNEVNLRTGPGLTYPIDWIYKRDGMPVEVIEEFDTWRKIRDWQGTEGWVHQSMLDGKRDFLITGERRTMRLAPEMDARPAARLEPGVIGQLFECDPVWCRAEVQGYRGWLKREWFWGTYPSETF
jgi:SH3-like domain-containing protein